MRGIEAAKTLGELRVLLVYVRKTTHLHAHEVAEVRAAVEAKLASFRAELDAFKTALEECLLKDKIIP